MKPASYQSGFSPRDGVAAFPHLWRGCIGAWAPALGPTGLTLRDWGHYRSNGTLTNSPTWITSQGKYAITFNASNKTVTMPSINAGTTHTASLWFYATSTPTNNILFGAANTFSYMLLIGSSGTAFVYRADNPSTDFVQITSVSMSINVWNHYAVTRTGSSVVMWLNGKIIGSGSLAGNGTAYVDSINANGYSLPGHMDDIRLYNRVLTHAEIRTLSLRRGIAYELSSRGKPYSSGVAFNRRRRLLVGAGS